MSAAAGLAAAPGAAADFGTILVLYHPRGEEIEHWLGLRAEAGRLVAVDNSPHADVTLYRRLAEAGIKLLVNRNRGGLAGAYNRGAQWLQQQGCRAMFLLDQDSQVEAGFFAAMLAARPAISEPAFILGPQIYEARLGRMMPTFDPARAWPRSRRPARGHTLVPSLCVISSGSLISMSAWQRLGGFREDYFIEYIDIEYALRAWHQGVPVYVNTAAVLVQQAGEIVCHGRFHSTHHPAWRRYYAARNALHALRLYPGRRPLLLAGLLLLAAQAMGIMCFEADKRAKLQAIGLGLVDGWQRRLGRLQTCRPGLARRCGLD